MKKHISEPSHNWRGKETNLKYVSISLPEDENLIPSFVTAIEQVSPSTPRSKGRK